MILNYYKEKNIYKDRYVSITKSLEYYFKNHKDLNLIKEVDIYNLMDDYNTYRKKNNLPLDINDDYKDYLEEVNVKIESLEYFSDDNYTSKYDSISDISNENEILINETESNHDSNNHNDDSHGDKKNKQKDIYILKKFLIIQIIIILKKEILKIKINI